ncbi:hypothetical protein ACUJ46_08165 [Sandaracinobacteroides sp. A072]|uniref:hypothetical protein n=1 Tax=Sandaracinobacteroides sp. A072 TaxID=3461146 RepID=UPI004041F72E
MTIADNTLLWFALAALAIALLVAWLALRPRPPVEPTEVSPAEPPMQSGKAEPGGADGSDASPADAGSMAASPFLPGPEGEPDDLMRIKGIGPKLSARLAELGVFHYRQIADWTPEQLAHVDSQLGQFQGRPERDQWQSQARLLASGDVKAYERAHGKLGPSA